MRILLHICCGPCAIYCTNTLRNKNHKVEGFFYNPNIYPREEYCKRKEAVKTVSEKISLPVYFYREAEFEDFFKQVPNDDAPRRCLSCWKIRVEATAEFAKSHNFDGFTSTLLISPYQDHVKIKQIAEDVAGSSGVNFCYEDFRPGFKESHSLSRQMQLYHQKYCGCIYSERERCSVNL